METRGVSLDFRSDIVLQLQNHVGTDEDICRAAWVSSGNAEENVTDKRKRGLIRALMRERHGTPFETGYFQFYAEAPRGVRDEAVRHRMLSFSASSLRYAFGRKEVYLPPRERPFIKAEGFKQIQPKYVPMNDEQYDFYTNNLKMGYLDAHYRNQKIMDAFDSTEAARFLTTDGHYFSFIMRMNPRALMHFLGLRTHNETANHVSYPMWEIMVMADQMEQIFAEKLPFTYEAWNEFGRESP